MATTPREPRVLKRRNTDKICIIAMTAACALALLLAAWNGGADGGPARGPEYAAALFDGGRVHQIDIEIENWEKFIKNATREEYSPCAVTIDGERFGGAGIRAKGNNSLRLTHKYGPLHRGRFMARPRQALARRSLPGQQLS